MDDISASASAVDTRPVGRRGAPLGTTAKSSSPLVQEDAKKTRAKRAQRFQALSQAREWLYLRAQNFPEQHAGDVYRTHDCRWARRSEYVGVHFSALHQSAHYGNLATCGSVWACPVCCAKIQQKRRCELVQLVEWAWAQDYRPSMITFTFPHTAFDSLADLVSKQRAAFKRLRSGKRWQALKNSSRFGGLVRSLELTHGANGWHPHTHELWLIRTLTVSELTDFRGELVALWKKACASVGLLDLSDSAQLHAFELHSVDVRHGVSSGDYLAKQDSARAWGVDSELAASSSKNGRLAGVHPHEFLIRQAPGDRERYFEYVEAMKGARQLFWSPGLKKRVGVVEVTDKEATDEQTEAAECLGLLTADMWRVVRGNDARAELLDVAELRGWPGVVCLLASLGVVMPVQFVPDGGD